MAEQDSTIWLAPAAAGCAVCVPTSDGSACRGAGGDTRCERPELVGDVARAGHVLQALRGVTFEDGGPDLVSAGQVRRLAVDDGEAELTLGFPPGCGSRQRAADAAFRVLRRLLPDTDVYVRHAG